MALRTTPLNVFAVKTFKRLVVIMIFGQKQFNIV